MAVAHQFADFLASTTTAGTRAIAQAKAALFDLTIAAVAGYGTKGALAAREAARSSWGDGAAPVWFAGEQLTIPGAAFANSAAASMVDLDDGHRAAAGHPGASIIPAVLATAAVHGATDERILTAIALGYDVAVRIASSRDFDTLTTMVSGPWVGQGAAAAAAWLRNLDPRAISQAIAIAGASAPNLSAVAYSRVMGNQLKEGIPWATATGLAAVDLAAAGFTGPIDLLDNDAIFDPVKLLDGLGETWAIEGIYFKPYGCCRWAHAAIDAILALKAELKFSASEVETIHVHTFGWALRLNNDCSPATVKSAQYSVPFCVALAAARGGEPLVRLSEKTLLDEEVLMLAKRVELVLDPMFESLFPGAVPARVVIDTSTGQFEKTVMSPLGEPTNPLDWSALQRKFHAVASGHLLEKRSNSLLRAVGQLASGDTRPLIETMNEPLDS